MFRILKVVSVPVTQATHTWTIRLTFLTWVSAMTGPKLKLSFACVNVCV